MNARDSEYVKSYPYILSGKFKIRLQDMISYDWISLESVIFK